MTNSLSSVTTQLQQAHEQQRQNNDEISKRDERIVSLKVDIVSTEERFKLKDEEVCFFFSKSLQNSPWLNTTNISMAICYPDVLQTFRWPFVTLMCLFVN